MDRQNYLRVTTILAPFSGLSQVPKDILDKACERGTKVHDCCDSYIKACKEGMGCPIPEACIAPYYESFLEWVWDKDILEAPPRFYDDVLEITGECDALMKVEDKLVIVDFKTSAKVGKTWPLQAAAYCRLANNAGYEIEEAWFVQLSKEGKSPEVHKYKLVKHYAEWLACLKMYLKYFSNINLKFEDLI